MEKYLTIPISFFLVFGNFIFISIILSLTSNDLIDNSKGLKRLFYVYSITSFSKVLAILSMGFSRDLLWFLILIFIFEYFCYSLLFIFKYLMITFKTLQNKISLIRIKMNYKKRRMNMALLEKKNRKTGLILSNMQKRFDYIKNYNPSESNYMNKIDSSIFDNVKNYLVFTFKITIRAYPIGFPVGALIFLYFYNPDFKLSFPKFAIEHIDYLGFIIIGLCIIWGTISTFIINAITVFLRVFKLNHLHHNVKMKNSISFMIGSIAILILISHEPIITSDVQLLKQYDNIISMLVTIISIVFIPILLEFLFNRQSNEALNLNSRERDK